MKFKAYTGITWSILELTGLLEDEDSRVYYEKFKKHLGLHPFHLTNLNAALNEILSSNLNSYDAELKGFLLAYKNPKLLTPLGEIFYDTCFIHVDIEADFYIFRPEVGCTLKGIVNKKGLDHIGVLVHKAFNVSIPKPDDEENWPGENVEIGQEVRFVITLLDFSSKLPFIRGVLNPDEYLRGCRLMEKTNNNRKQFLDSNIESNTENSIKKTSEKGGKHAKGHTFFATDSENTSDEDVPHVKKEIVQQKRSKKKHEPEEPIECSEENKEDKKRAKKNKEGKESKRKIVKEEAVHDRYTNNNSVNGDLEESEQLEPTDSKSKAKKKSKAQSSQSNIDENYTDVKSENRARKRASKKLSNPESADDINKIKLEHRAASSDVEQAAEESIVESKPKIKKLSLKRKLLDDSDTSSADFSTDKYIKGSSSPSKKSSKKMKTIHADSEEKPVFIKSEQSNNVHNSNLNSDVDDTPKKKHKKHKNSLKVEASENKEDRSIQETSIKKHSKKSSILDSEFVLQNIRIKKEKVTSGSENTQDEEYAETNNVAERDSEIYRDQNIEGDDENDATKKKRKKHSKKHLIDTSKIKLEPMFEDVIVKIEKPDYIHNDSIMEDGHSVEGIPNISSLKKEYQTEMQDDTHNEEVDTKSSVKRSKKKAMDKEAHSVKVKTEKLTETDVSDADYPLKKRKHSKTSPHKRSSKSTELESDIESKFDFRNVKVKTERFTDS